MFKALVIWAIPFVPLLFPSCGYDSRQLSSNSGDEDARLHVYREMRQMAPVDMDLLLQAVIRHEDIGVLDSRIIPLERITESSEPSWGGKYGGLAHSHGYLDGDGNPFSAGAQTTVESSTPGLVYVDVFAYVIEDENEKSEESNNSPNTVLDVDIDVDGIELRVLEPEELDLGNGFSLAVRWWRQ